LRVAPSRGPITSLIHSWSALPLHEQPVGQRVLLAEIHPRHDEYVDLVLIGEQQVGDQPAAAAEDRAENLPLTTRGEPPADDTY
jgi:hypothetical protein